MESADRESRRLDILSVKKEAISQWSQLWSDSNTYRWIEIASDVRTCVFWVC